MISPLEVQLKRLGRLHRISGNRPIALDDPRCAWYILSGRAEIFSVEMEDGRLVGAKTHFFSQGAGGLLLGMDAEVSGQCFQAVGFPNTHVVELPLTALENLCREEEHRKALGEMIDAWVAGLSQGMTREILPRPRNQALFTPGQPLAVDEDTVAGVAEGTVWACCREGLGLFIGMENLAPGQGCLPLCPHSWIRMLAGCRVESWSTREVMAQGRLFEHLGFFHELLLQMLMLNAGMGAVDRYNLVREKADRDRALADHGFSRLASVLGEARAEAAASEPGESPLVGACVRVARHLELPMNPWPREAEAPRTVEEVGERMGIRTRQVRLEGEWWRRELGPLVGFRCEDHAPVALIPQGRAYVVQDPGTGESAPLTPALARGITAAAHTFYRPLPEGRLTLTQLVAHGLKGCGRELRWVLSLGTIMGLISLIPPMATDVIFSEIIPGAQRGRLVHMVILLAGLTLATALFELCRNIGLLRVEQRLHYVLESGLWDRIIRLPIPFFKDYSAGDLVSRGLGLTLVRQMVAGPVVTGILGSLFSIFNLFLLFYYHAHLAWVGLGLILTAGLVVLGLGRLQLKYFRPMAQVEGRLSGRVNQFLTAVTKLRMAGAEDRAFALWAEDFSEQKGLAYRGGKMENHLTAFNSGFMLLSMMVLFGWLIFMEADSGLTTGKFLAFNAAFGNLQAAVFQMIISLNTCFMAAPHWERISPILEARPEVGTGRSDPGELTGRVELVHASFRYGPDSPRVIRDLSLSFSPGEFVAVVGASGAGKSTLIRLLLGFETPESGAVLFDDQDLAELDIARVRRNMGVVLQGSLIMAGDIFQNIVGSRPLNLEQAWDAAERAGLAKDIREMPMGMNTVIMEGGGTLSGGQLQRLMIARAIVDYPRILIFDEATSALDNRTQAQVIKSLKEMEATRIVVAHRLSTIQDADRILVMDGGRVAESGSYDDLMAQGTLFQKIARRQLITMDEPE